MSVINDALKQAQKQSSTPPAPTPPWTPVQPARYAGWLLPFAALALTAIACLVIVVALTRHPVQHLQARSKSGPVVPAIAKPAVQAPVPKIIAPPVSTAPAVHPPAPSSPPKLQGIVYNSTRSWAIVDGKTVYTGDRLGDLQVVTISATSVVLSGHGTTSRLQLKP